MGRFFGRLSGALSRFLYGRNGTDQLGTAVLVVYLALMILRSVVVMFTRSHLAAGRWT